MTPLSELLQWYNFVFVFPLFAGLLALLVSAYGAAFESGSESGHETVHETEQGAHVEADHAVESEIEHHLETDVGHQVEGGHLLEGGSEPGPHAEVGHAEQHGDQLAGEAHDHGLAHSLGQGWSAALALLGAGEAPFTVVLQSLLLWWGALGWLANQLWSQVLPRPESFIWPSMATALLGSVGLTRGTAKLLGRLLPKESTAILGSEELEAQVGEVVFTVTEESGWVQLYDHFGTLHQLPARTEPGKAPIARGCKVLLVCYERDRGVYRVEPADWWDDDRSTGQRLVEDDPKDTSRLVGLE